MRKIILSLIILIVGCSYTNENDRPEYVERLFKLQMSPSTPATENTCLIDCGQDVVNCPDGRNNGGTIPVISWLEAHPDTEQFVIILQSDETHIGVDTSNGTSWGCWPGSTDAGARITNCVHMVVYQIPVYETQIDITLPKKQGTPDTSADTAYGNTLTSYGVLGSPYPNEGRRYNGPCPPGFFYPEDVYDFLVENSPAGKYNYEIRIYALNTTGIAPIKNGNYPYNFTSFENEFADAIIESAILNFTYDFSQ